MSNWASPVFELTIRAVTHRTVPMQTGLSAGAFKFTVGARRSFVAEAVFLGMSASSIRCRWSN